MATQGLLARDLAAVDLWMARVGRTGRLMVALERKGLFMDGLELASRDMNARVIAMAEMRMDLEGTG